MAETGICSIRVFGWKNLALGEAGEVAPLSIEGLGGLPGRENVGIVGDAINGGEGTGV